ncbi:MAG TPA: molybdenum cofactor biosynthesis protein MoaE [Chthoniobacterales bacterium]|nr:molybdenum cofactor biosynthesis protein MoaE [Chthoniobacterales bacterium]
MAISVCEVSLTESPLDLPEARNDPGAGAIVVFWGAVRASEDGREITGIEYEAHRAMAEHQMRLVADSAAEKFEVKELLLHHRIGFVPVSQPSVVVRVTSAHRGAAFAASQWIMDELKRVVPIWKHPVFKEAPVNLAGQPKSPGALV